MCIDLLIQILDDFVWRKHRKKINNTRKINDLKLLCYSIKKKNFLYKSDPPKKMKNLKRASGVSPASG